MATVFIPVDKCTKSNGCLQVNKNGFICFVVSDIIYISFYDILTQANEYPYYLHFILRLCFTQKESLSRLYVYVSFDGILIGVESSTYTTSQFDTFVMAEFYCFVTSQLSMDYPLKHLIS